MRNEESVRASMIAAAEQMHTTFGWYPDTILKVRHLKTNRICFVKCISYDEASDGPTVVFTHNGVNYSRPIDNFLVTFATETPTLPPPPSRILDPNPIAFQSSKREKPLQDEADRIRLAGWKAAQDGKPEVNPYPVDTARHGIWQRGYMIGSTDKNSGRGRSVPNSLTKKHQ